MNQLPVSDRILIEAGTPFIKRYGADGIRQIVNYWSMKTIPAGVLPYIVADLKTMDRGDTEVLMAKDAGASAAIGLGLSLIETIHNFI